MPKARTRRRTNRRRTGARSRARTNKRKRTSRSRSTSRKRTTRRRRRNPAKAKPRANRRRRRRRNSAKAKPRANRRRRRRRRNSTKAKPRANRRRRRRSSTTRRRRRRSTARRNPVRRRRRRRRSTARRNMRRRSYGRRRRRRARRNAGPVKSVRAQLKHLMKPATWLAPAVHGAIGFGIASYGPTVLSRYTSQFGLRNYGFGGVALSGISTALGAGLLGWLSGMLPKSGLIGKCCKGMAKNVFIGGAIATAIRLAHELMPTSPLVQYLPRIGMSPMPVEATSGMGYYSGSGYGTYPGQYPSYGPLGMVESPEQLVASESFARQVNQLEGMGQPVPVEDIASWLELSGGMGGMGDWMSFTPGSPLAERAAAGDPGFPGPQGF